VAPKAVPYDRRDGVANRCAVVHAVGTRPTGIRAATACGQGEGAVACEGLGMGAWARLTGGVSWVAD
jgi:hypothetical protein